MAALICPVCRHQGESGVCPTHIEPLVPEDPAETPPAATCPEPGCDNPAGPGGPCLLHAIGVPATPVAPAGPAGEAGPRLDPTAGRLALRFPWGIVEIPASGLTVGRSTQVSPLASHITDETYPNVSRRHAVIMWDGVRLTVYDPGSTNHTFLNEKQIGTHTKVELRAGDVVRFGRDLAAIVVEHTWHGLLA